MATPGPAGVHELVGEVVGDAEEAAPVLVLGGEVATRAQPRGQPQQQPRTRHLTLHDISIMK